MNEKHYTYQHNNIFSYLTFLNQRIDIFCTPKISKSLITFLEEKGFPNIILDMRKVIYTDSAGFGLLISILTKCKKNGNHAVIVCKENSLINDLKISGVYSLFPIFTSIESAKSYIIKNYICLQI